MSVRQGSSIIALGNTAIDGNTISTNNNGSLQANGVVNQNTATGAIPSVYDWVGTLAEYTTQDVATNHPEWICFITDDDSITLFDTEWASGLGMPDFMHTLQVTLLASGSEYTAPANGYFLASGKSGNNMGTIQIVNTTNGTLPEMRVSSWATGANGRFVGVLYPIKVGEKIVLYYGSSTTDINFYFIYAVGNGQ